MMSHFLSTTGNHMSDRLLKPGIIPALALLFAPILAHTQDYPAKPVRLITAEPGGGHDLAARLIAQGLSADLGQQFIVDNRAGAMIAGEYVAKAPPDGYTLMIYGGSLWLAPFMRNTVPYDVIRDFAPIGPIQTEMASKSNVRQTVARLDSVTLHRPMRNAAIHDRQQDR